MKIETKKRYMEYYERTRKERKERKEGEKKPPHGSNKESILKKLKELKGQEFILQIPVENKDEV